MIREVIKTKVYETREAVVGTPVGPKWMDSMNAETGKIQGCDVKPMVGIVTTGGAVARGVWRDSGLAGTGKLI